MKSLSNTTQKSDDEMTIEELREELSYLRTENAVLKNFEELKQKNANKQRKSVNCFSSQS